MPALREVFAEYSIEFDRRRNLRRGNRAVLKLKVTLTRLRSATASAARGLAAFGVVAGGAAAAGVHQMVTSTTESIRELDRWSARIGINQDALQSWIGVGAQFGLSADDIADPLKELQIKAQDALQGSTEMTEAFQRAGISLDDLRPIVNDADALMLHFTDSLGRVADQSVRNHVVDELLSDDGTRMIPIFRLGTAEITRRRAAYNATVGPTATLLQQIREHTQRVAALTAKWTAFKREVTARVLPILAQIGEKLSGLLQPIRDVITGTNLLTGALIGLGIVAAIVAVLTIELWAPVVAVALAVAYAVGIIAVAYDQVSRTIEGADTWLSRFIDGQLGVGATEGIILLIGDAWDRLTGRIEAAVGWAVEFAETLGPLVDIVNAILAVVNVITGRYFAGVVYDWATGALGGAAQERVAEERRREGAPARQQRRQRTRRRQHSAHLVGDESFAAGFDAFDRPISRQRDPLAHVSPTVAGLRPVARRAERTPSTINAPMTLNLNIAEAIDINRFEGVATRVTERALARQTRALESMNQLAEAET